MIDCSGRCLPSAPSQFLEISSLWADDVCDDGVSTLFNFNCEVYGYDGGVCGGRQQRRGGREREQRVPKDGEDYWGYVEKRKEGYGEDVGKGGVKEEEAEEVLERLKVEGWKHRLSGLSSRFKGVVEESRGKRGKNGGSKYPTRVNPPTNAKELVWEKKKEIKRIQKEYNGLTEDQKRVMIGKLTKEIHEIYKGNHEFKGGGERRGDWRGKMDQEVLWGRAFTTGGGSRPGITIRRSIIMMMKRRSCDQRW
ncbi:hypothetical protein TL16_g00961 [Triparma laevis f. inornata]|uniref:Uncharacterized protein n=1 Tax=Triparma laevis f. inornata TaxID=1714386 RepID=A0A9W6ZJM3_9STRA|nr:hypothetical protein TL16_g00961 [Triparma laevis f. inornata]